MKDKIQVLYNGQEVQSLQFLALKVLNNGNVPILESDFAGPLAFTFGAEALIIKWDWAERHPATVEPKVDIEVNRLAIHPIQLNSQDFFIIRVLISKFDRLQITAPIVGIQHLKKVTDLWQDIEYKFWLSVWGGAILSTVIALILLGLSNWLYPAWSTTICIWSAALGIAGGLIRAQRTRAEEKAELHDYYKSW